jgi:uracil-DNA glycosylase
MDWNAKVASFFASDVGASFRNDGTKPLSETARQLCALNASYRADQISRQHYESAKLNILKFAAKKDEHVVDMDSQTYASLLAQFSERNKAVNSSEAHFVASCQPARFSELDLIKLFHKSSVHFAGDSASRRLSGKGVVLAALANLRRRNLISTPQYGALKGAVLGELPEMYRDSRIGSACRLVKRSANAKLDLAALAKTLRVDLTLFVEVFGGDGEGDGDDVRAEQRPRVTRLLLFAAALRRAKLIDDLERAALKVCIIGGEARSKSFFAIAHIEEAFRRGAVDLVDAARSACAELGFSKSPSAAAVMAYRRGARQQKAEKPEATRASTATPVLRWRWSMLEARNAPPSTRKSDALLRIARAYSERRIDEACRANLKAIVLGGGLLDSIEPFLAGVPRTIAAVATASKAKPKMMKKTKAKTTSTQSGQVGSAHELPSSLLPSSGWREHLAAQFGKPYFRKLMATLQSELDAGKHVWPQLPDVFAALNMCSHGDVRVVLLGQDPYHAPGQAMGLSFSVPRGVPAPPSLRNMYKELGQDASVRFALPHKSFGDLSSWARQGVLLLNATLTVREHMANSHSAFGWQQFTDSVIRAVNAKRTPVVFLLWGGFAQKKRSMIDEKRHRVLVAPHPSPLSASRGFFGCGHFSETNRLLAASRQRPIEWSLVGASQKEVEEEKVEEGEDEEAAHWVQQKTLSFRLPARYAGAGVFAVHAFDLDDTLTRPLGGRKFARDGADWQWWHASVKDKLASLSAEQSDALVAVFTNQRGVSLGRTRLADVHERIEAVMRAAGVGAHRWAALISTHDDRFRKPDVGMWRTLVSAFHGHIDIARSVYVGDAAGRPGDHSNSDEAFARRVPLRFATPELYFLGARSTLERYVSTPLGAALRQLATLPPLDDVASALQLLAADDDESVELVVLVARPASGKSTLIEACAARNANYRVVSRDVLGTQKRCLREAGTLLRDGHSVIVDNTSPSAAARSVYVNLAHSLGVRVRAIHLDLPELVSRRLNEMRRNSGGRSVPNIGFAMFRKHFQRPLADEGFDQVLRIDNHLPVRDQQFLNAFYSLNL